MPNTSNKNNQIKLAYLSLTDRDKQSALLFCWIISFSVFLLYIDKASRLNHSVHEHNDVFSSPE